MRYYWLSFSKIVEEGETSNIGAYLMTDERELDQSGIIAAAKKRGCIPDGTPSIWGGEIDEKDALLYPLNVFMSREELMLRNDVVTQRSSICSSCADNLNGGPVEGI